MGIIDKIKQKRAEKQLNDAIAGFVASKLYIEFFMPKNFVTNFKEMAETIYHPADDKELKKAIDKLNKVFSDQTKKDIATLKKLAEKAIDGNVIGLMADCNNALKTLHNGQHAEKINLPKTLISECQEFASLAKAGKLAAAADGSDMPKNIFEMFSSILQDQKTLVKIVEARENFLTSDSDHARESLENATRATINSVGKKYLNIEFYPDQAGTTERWVDTDEYKPEKPQGRLKFLKDKQAGKGKSGSEKGDDQDNEKRP